MCARLIVRTVTAASVMSEVEVREYECGPKRGQRFQLRDACGESPSILALVPARVIPYYYSFTGSQPNPAVKQQQFTGPGGERIERRQAPSLN